GGAGVPGAAVRGGDPPPLDVRTPGHPAPHDPPMSEPVPTPAAFVADLERKPEALARLADALADPGSLAQVPVRPWRVVLTGMGSSRDAAEVSAARLRAAGIDAVAELASATTGWPPGPNVLVLAISATGGSVETL